MAITRRVQGIATLLGVVGLAMSAIAQDVTRPGDTIVGSSDNYPGGEPPEGAIDNTARTKYLNFDKLGTGFSVTPTGTGIVRGIVLVTAGDAPERDPTSFVLEGTNDGGATYVVIASGPVVPPVPRWAIYQASFANSATYSGYRVTFPTVRTENAANSMQIAEVQLVTQSDILTPGDPYTVTYFPGSTESVGEEPFHLFEERVADKFGVFNGNLGPTIITVTPSIGSTTITGVEVVGGNDDEGFPGRTPSYIKISGSNNGSTFTQLLSTPLTQTTLDLQSQEFSFANSTSYTSYRIELGPCTGDTFLQLGEIQLFGVASSTPPPNDNCSSPITVTAGSSARNNFNATGTDITSCGSNDTRDVWFRYVATANGLVEVNTIGLGTLDTTLAVFTTCGGSAIACNDNAKGSDSRVTFTGTSGQAYLIRVAGANGGQGSFPLNIINNPVTHTDVKVALNYNWNGMVHNGESGDADNPTGFRSILDRALRVDGVVGSVDVGLEGNTGIAYGVVAAAGALDIVHLGDRNVNDNGTRTWDTEPDGDNVGIQPTWLPDSDQFGPQTTDVSALGLAMADNTSVGVLFNAANGGNRFNLTLNYSDASSSTVQLSAPDWFGQQNPENPLPGVATQTSLGVFAGTGNTDLGDDDVPLNVVEATVSTASLIAAGLPDPTYKNLRSITISNAENTVSAIAVYAATVRDAGPACLIDFDHNGFANADDYDAYVVAFEAGAITADYDGNGFVNGDDFDAFVIQFEAGC